jgi:hypothetical protein
MSREAEAYRCHPSTFLNNGRHFSATGFRKLQLLATYNSSLPQLPSHLESLQVILNLFPHIHT